MDQFLFEAGALIPSIGVGLLFWFVIRAILNADRREREAEKEAERLMREQEKAEAAAPEHEKTASTVESDAPNPQK